MLKKPVKAVALMLTTAMLLALASCGAVAPTTAPTAAISQAEPIELNMFISSGTQFTPDDCEVLRVLEQATNTKLSFELPPSNNYNERLQIVFATDDLPDIIHITAGNETLHRNAAELGNIIALDEYLDSAPNIMAAINPNSWASMKLLADNKIYGLPKATLQRSDGFLVRSDWLKKFDITIPDNNIITIDQFVDILRKFTFEDPDGNGKKDTYGITLGPKDHGGLGTIEWLNGTFGIFGWQKAESGPYEYMSAVYDKTTDNFKNAIAFSRMLWEEELVDPNWPNNVNEGNLERFYAGFAGVVPSTTGSAITREASVQAVTPTAEIDYIARVILKEGDTSYGAGFGNGAWGCMALTSAAEKNNKVEAAINFLDYQVSPEGWHTVVNGIPGIHYNEVNGKKEFTPEYDKYLPQRGVLVFLRVYSDVRFFTGPANMDEAVAEKVTKWTQACFDNLVISQEFGYVAKAQKEQKYLDYEKVLNEGISKIVVGSAPLDSWDELLDGWYKNGGEEVVKEYNEYIKDLEVKK